MRISFNMQNEQTLLTLNDKEEQINQISQSISTGVKLTAPSDDPLAWAQSMNIKDGLSEYDSVLKNIDFASGWEQTTDSALNQLSNLVSQAKQVAMSAVSATSSGDKQTLGSQIGSILTQALNLANSQFGNQYVFSGTNTSTAPFSIDNTTGTVTYNGDSNYISVRTDRSSIAGGNTTPINLNGNDVFTFSNGAGSANVLQEIWNLQQAVTSGNTTEITSKMNLMDSAFDNINSQSAINGGRLSQLDNQKSAISVFQTNAKGQLSNLQDTDIAEAATKLQQAQTAFQAALQVTAQLKNLNLASILGG